jgi:hypothetical protein
MWCRGFPKRGTWLYSVKFGARFDKVGKVEPSEMGLKAMTSHSDVEISLDEDDALGLLRAIYRAPGVPLPVRMRAAIAALPFERPKLAVIASVSTEDLVERMQRALQATGKVIEGRATRLLETKPAQVVSPTPATQELVTAEDMAKPMARLDTARFRRL